MSKIFENLAESTSPTSPCVLTIGSFDGVHLGHQQLLKQMRSIAGENGSLCVVTFSNHPSFILPGKTPVPLIFSKDMKMNYLSKFGVDFIYCLDFTLELSSMAYDVFLLAIRQACPFDHLILGEGASLGKKREGSSEKVKALGNTLGFTTQYLSKLSKDEETISSGLIRTCIQEGNLSKATALLGHPYMIEGIASFDKLVIPAHLCLPPDGEYFVTIDWDSHQNRTLICIENGVIRLDANYQNKKILLSF